MVILFKLNAQIINYSVLVKYILTWQLFLVRLIKFTAVISLLAIDSQHPPSVSIFFLLFFKFHLFLKNARFEIPVSFSLSLPIEEAGPNMIPVHF